MRSDSETSRENEPSPVVDSTAPLEPKFIEEIFNVIDFRDTNRDLMLHFNPRFKHGYIAINAFKNNVWQREKRIPSPFEYEKVYTVDFVFKENSAIVSRLFPIFMGLYKTSFRSILIEPKESRQKSATADSFSDKACFSLYIALCFPDVRQWAIPV
ncbi:hypothetical protein Y032_0233g3099 [Ancylostoma ceylanicum]|uniref:Galectin n=1 Tax=Ancylostoma ceylanicum TaxID=53326 RepID=A0A016SF37_9BILA|nr:hypothetical protein Y032_0233g3099 [Ancylostoma ceylanicum]